MEKYMYLSSFNLSIINNKVIISTKIYNIIFIIAIIIFKKQLSESNHKKTKLTINNITSDNKAPINPIIFTVLPIES